MIGNAASMTRHNFAVGGAALAGTAALAAMPALAAEPVVSALPETWDYEADVVVVGAGAAGYMAACAAAEEGATALLLEKNHATGGDSAVSGCITIGFWPERTKLDGGFDDTIELWLEDQKNSHPYSHKGMAGLEIGDLSFIKRQAELMPETYKWFEENTGTTWSSWYYIKNGWTPQPGWDSVFPRDWNPSGGIIPPLRELADSNDSIEVVTTAQVTDILQDAEGRAVGVRLVLNDERVAYAKANRAVILSTGTFNSNRGMMYKYLGYQMANLAVAASCGQTGDGHIMAQKIGGALRDMDLGSHWSSNNLSGTTSFTGSMSLYGSAPVYESSVPGILINRAGKRYCSESLGYSLIAKNTAQQQFNLAWYVVDSKSTQFVIPEDLAQDIVATGDTLEDLARGMLVDPQTLVDEVARYNAFVEAGTDDDFGKLLAGCPKIEDGPFYAVAINGLPYTTYGGIAVDVDGHVLTVDGGTIPNLYAAGLCTGSFAEQAGVFYLGGMAQAIAFGRQAGKHAAAETAWA